MDKLVDKLRGYCKKNFFLSGEPEVIAIKTKANYRAFIPNPLPPAGLDTPSHLSNVL